MVILRKPSISLFVDRSTGQWIIRDQEGDLWVLPAVDQPWEHRQPYLGAPDTELEPVPGHYKRMLGVPF